MKRKKQTSNEQYLMVTDAARLLKRSSEMVRQYEKVGRLPAIKTANGHRLFRRSDVLKLAAELGSLT